MLTTQRHVFERQYGPLLSRPVPLGVSAVGSTLYTATSDFLIESFFMAPVGASPNVSVWLVPEGGSAGASNLVLNGFTPSSTVIFEALSGLLIGPGTQIVTSGNNCNVGGWGREQLGGRQQ